MDDCEAEYEMELGFGCGPGVMLGETRVSEAVSEAEQMLERGLDPAAALTAHSQQGQMFESLGGGLAVLVAGTLTAP